MEPDAAAPGVPPLVPDAPKQAWREWAREARRQLDLSFLSDAIVGHLAEWEPLRVANMVLTYVAIAEEVDLEGLADLIPPGRLVVTRTPESGPLTIHAFAEPREVHRYGFQQPTADAAVLDPADVDVALVPGLVFDAAGRRLGWGVGYFDQLLATLRDDALRVGIVPKALVTLSLPWDDWDVPMTHLATEDGVVEVG